MFREDAPRYAALGWPVFPLQARGKMPVIPRAHEPGHGCRGECGQEGHGFHDATTDPEQIEAWVERFPDANTGIRCGGQGPDVLDVDGPTGEASLVELGGVQPGWVESRSGREDGGRHFWFQATAPRRIGFKPGLEWCGEGGYVVAPGSIHRTGTRYTWTTGQPPRQLPQAPAWATRPPVPEPSTGTGIVIPAVQGPHRDWSLTETIPSGSRHSTLLGFTWWLAEQGTAREVARVAVQQMLTKQLEGTTPKVTAAEAWGMFETACTKLADPTYRDALENQEPLTASKSTEGPVVTWASEIEETELRWLSHPYFPLGTLGILEGDPDLGKSVLTLDQAASITRGRPWPKGATSDLDGPRAVLVICAEDDWSNVVLPRLRVAGADLSLVASMTVPRDDRGEIVPLSIPGDLPRIRRAIREASRRAPVALVIIDPITAYLSEIVKTGVDHSVRRALEPLGEVAREEACTVVLVRHLNKQGGLKAMYRGGGSIAFSGVVRASFVVARHPEDPAVRVLAKVKTNYARHDLKLNLAYTIASAAEDEGLPVVQWGGHVELTADELVGGRDHRKDAPRKQECKDAILKIFAAEGNRVAARLIKQELAKELGFSEDTIRRAKEELPIADEREYQKGRKGVRQWYWRLATTGVSGDLESDRGA